MNAIPEQFSSITPYLIIKGAAEAISFYEKAFGAEEVRRMNAHDKIMHAEIKIGNSHIMLSDEFLDFGFSSPETLGGSPVFIHLYVEDADQTFEDAIQAGASSIKPVSDQFFGDRHGQVKDPFGYIWTIATHIEDVSNELLQERMDAYLAKEMS